MPTRAGAARPSYGAGDRLRATPMNASVPLRHHTALWSWHMASLVALSGI